MANKQTEELGLYCGSLGYIEDESYLKSADILAWSEWEVKRISMPKLIEYISNSSSFGEEYNDWAGFVGKSITIDKIKSSGHTTRGVCFSDGISLCEKDITDSWIGYWQVNPKNYGFKDDTNIPANVCYGTFGMETVYINDLYVKNLHTADSSSSGSSSEMETATITNLTTDTLTPKESCGLVHIRGGISFDSDVYGIFKFDHEYSRYSFDNGLYVGGDSSISFNAGQMSPEAKIYFGEGDCFVTNRGIWIQPYHGQQYGYLYAGNCDKAEVFNAGGTLTKIYSQTEIDDKIKALEARIAALESK